MWCSLILLPSSNILEVFFEEISKCHIVIVMYILLFSISYYSIIYAKKCNKVFSLHAALT